MLVLKQQAVCGLQQHSPHMTSNMSGMLVCQGAKYSATRCRVLGRYLRWDWQESVKQQTISAERMHYTSKHC